MTPKKKSKPAALALEPVDGKFKMSAAARRAWCKETGHLQAFLNLSLSGKEGCRVTQCLCGKVQEREARPAPAA